MNQLEMAIFVELKAAASFQEFFVKTSILQMHFNRTELKTLSKVIKHEVFVQKYGWPALTYMNDNIHKEMALPFNNISEKSRIRKMLAEYEKEVGDCGDPVS